jgi:hypothetical protein
MSLFTVEEYGQSAQPFVSPATAFLAGLSSSYAGSNLPAAPIVRYGAFAGPQEGDEANLTLSAFPVLWAPGQRGMIAFGLVRPGYNGGNPTWPYGNGGHGT